MSRGQYNLFLYSLNEGSLHINQHVELSGENVGKQKTESFSENIENGSAFVRIYVSNKILIAS